MSNSRKILADLSERKPSQFQIMLGYAAWLPNQLEQELLGNSWLICPSDPDIIFKTPIQQRWEATLNKLGINSHQLSYDIGHA